MNYIGTSKGHRGWRRFAWAVVVAIGVSGGTVALQAAEEAAESMDDIALPTDDASIAIGKARFGDKCGGFCHGAGGKGGRAPCLICGRFKHGGKASQIANNIASGIAGTAMGAFGGQYSREEIVAIVAFLRAEQKKKEAEPQ